ncbi:MAG: hypothetical protein R3F44_19715 [Candidatus Competibacteraceae bacterium]
MAQGGIEINRPVGVGELAGFDLQGFQITVQRGQRGAQIVRDMVDQLAAQGVALLQTPDQGLQALRHPVEMRAQLLDLVALRALAAIGRVHREIAALELVHQYRQPPQPAGQQPKQQQSGQQPGQKTANQYPSTEPQQQAVLVESFERFVHLAAQHHVQITFGPFRRGTGVAEKLLRASWLRGSSPRIGSSAPAETRESVPGQRGRV